MQDQKGTTLAAQTGEPPGPTPPAERRGKRAEKRTVGVFHPRYKEPRTGRTRPANTWSVRVHGKQVNGFKTQAEAKAFREQALVDLKAGRLTSVSTLKTTFEDLKELLIDDYTMNKKKSLERAELSVRHLSQVFGGNLAVSITTDRVSRYIVARQRNDDAANATINRELSMLHRMFVLGRRASKATTIPHISKLREDNARTGFFEPHQFQAVLTHLPEHLRPLFEVAYVTGWRVRSELLTRCWSHVDLNGGWLRLEPGETKNTDGRMSPLTPQLRTVLEGQQAHTERLERQLSRIIPHVFHRRGKAIKNYRKAWSKACVAAGCPGRIPHDLRRTAVRNLERAGVPRSAAMKMVGHKTEAIYRRCAITDDAMLKEGAVKLAVLHASESRLSASPDVQEAGKSFAVPAGSTPA